MIQTMPLLRLLTCYFLLWLQPPTNAMLEYPQPYKLFRLGGLPVSCPYLPSQPPFSLWHPPHPRSSTSPSSSYPLQSHCSALLPHPPHTPTTANPLWCSALLSDQTEQRHISGLRNLTTYSCYAASAGY